MEEFGSDINYIKGKANSVANAISRLNYSGNSHDSSVNPIVDLFIQEEEEEERFPMSLVQIAAAQEDYAALQEKLNDKNNKVYTTKIINDIELIHLNDKIYIPEPLRLNILN